MNYQPHLKTLREVLDEATAKHVASVLKGAHSMKEASITLGVSDETLSRMRKRYGFYVAPARNLKQMRIAA